MSTLFSRQDIYDYCRSVFSRQAIDVRTTPLLAGAETIMVVPGVSRPGTPFQPMLLSEWLEVEEKDTMLVYQLYHFQVCDVTFDTPHYTYQLEPVVDTKTAFPSSAALDSPVIGLWVSGSHTVIQESASKDVTCFYPFDVVIDQLNMRQSSVHQQQAEHLAGDIRERLYPTVNDSLPDTFFQRDVFRQRFSRQVWRRIPLYGIPFVLATCYLPAIAWLPAVLLLVEWCYIRKTTNSTDNASAAYLYRAINKWKQSQHTTPVGSEKWKTQTSAFLDNVKTLALTTLKPSRQNAYLATLDDLLRKVNQDSLTEDDIVKINTSIQKVIVSYTILAYYH